MKFSKYNIIHTTENQEHILFNSLWGSTFVISPSVKQAIEYHLIRRCSLKKKIDCL